MTEILSPEEKDRIRKEQMRRIAELEQKKKAGPAVAVLPEAVSAADAERKRRQAAEEFKAKVLAEEMTRRGFVRHGDEWITREEQAALATREVEEKERLAGKVERAKERKVDRDEAFYEKLKEVKAPVQRIFLPILYAGLAAMLAGVAVLWLFGVKAVGIGAFLNVAGGGAAIVAFYILFETERELMKAQRVEHDGEMHDFEYAAVKNPLRRLLRAFARAYDADIRRLHE